MVKSTKDATYVFAVAMRNGATKATFTVKGLDGKATAEVIGENRRIPAEGGKFADEFKPFDVHLYKITK